MREILAITKALADQNRLRILCALDQAEELCVCQIYELLQLAPSTTSKHLSLMLSAGLVDMRKDGRWAHYRIAGEDAPDAAREAAAWAIESLNGQKAIKEDRRRLREILRISPEELCQRQAIGQVTQDPACCSSARATRAGAKSRKGSRVRSKTK